MPANKEIQLHRMATLADFVADIDDLSDAELEEALRMEGIDPKTAVARVLSKVRQATWLDAAQVKRATSTSDSSVHARRRAAGLGRQQILQLIRSQGAAVSAQFRKNEGEMSDDDLRALVVHLGLLDGE